MDSGHVGASFLQIDVSENLVGSGKIGLHADNAVQEAKRFGDVVAVAFGESQHVEGFDHIGFVFEGLAEGGGGGVIIADFVVGESEVEGGTGILGGDGEHSPKGGDGGIPFFVAEMRYALLEEEGLSGGIVSSGTLHGRGRRFWLGDLANTRVLGKELAECIIEALGAVFSLELLVVEACEGPYGIRVVGVLLHQFLERDEGGIGFTLGNGLVGGRDGRLNGVGARCWKGRSGGVGGLLFRFCVCGWIYRRLWGGMG